MIWNAMGLLWRQRNGIHTSPTQNIPRTIHKMNDLYHLRSCIWILGSCVFTLNLSWGLWVVRTHWGRDKIAANFLATISNAFSWMKIRIFRLIKIPLKFVPKAPINNIPALFQVMARRRPGYKPLSEPIMACFLPQICVIRPQGVNCIF